MTFKQAVSATLSVSNAYCSGLRALRGRDRGLIKRRRGSSVSFTGSLNLDATLEAAWPSAPRWDYGIGLRARHAGSETAIWVEIHPASSTHVNDVLDKLRWLKDWLHNHAPLLENLTESGFYWVASGGTVSITPNSRQAKRLASAGLRGPKPVLCL